MELLARRDVALSSAQKAQIEDISKDLNPLCDNIQNIYIKLQGSMNDQMRSVKLPNWRAGRSAHRVRQDRLQQQMYCQAVGTEIGALGEAIDVTLESIAEVEVSVSLETLWISSF